MTFVNTCAENLRVAISDMELLTHDRTKESFQKLRGAILKRMKQTADMLEGHFEITSPEELAPPAPKPRRTRKVLLEKGENVIPVDFKARARETAESAFRK